MKYIDRDNLLLLFAMLLVLLAIALFFISLFR